MANMTEQYVHLPDGKKIYVRIYCGEILTGTTLVCLSGLVRTSQDFHDFATMMADEGHYVVSLDYRGRGRSDFDENPENYHPENTLRDVLQVLEKLEISSAVFVGTSFGGMISMGIAAFEPSLVQAVVMNDIGPGLSKEGLERIKAYIGHDHPQQSWEDAVTYLKGMYKTLGLTTEEQWMQLAKGTFKEGSDGLLHIQWDTKLVEILNDSSGTPNLWQLFAGLANVPALVIRGGVSDVLDAKTLDKMIVAKPDLKTVIIDGVGHCPGYHEPDVIKAIQDMIAYLGMKS